MMVADEAATAAAWSKAETLYSDRRHKISDVAALVGLSAIQLSQEAKRRGWPMRTAPRLAAGSTKESRQAQDKTLPAGSTKESRKAQEKTLPAGSTKESRKAQSKKPKGTKPIVLVQRLYSAIDGELSKLEQQRGVSSQDRERASRALSQITNSLEKAVEMQREMTKTLTKRSGAKHKEALAHAEDLRREIAERLERLQRQRAPSGRSGGAE